MSEGQETFVSHLIELRSRLIRAIVGVVVVFLCLVNWAREIYTLLATPMLAALPEGGHMIATDVAGAFPGAHEGDLDGGLRDRLALCALSGLGFCGAGSVCT